MKNIRFAIIVFFLSFIGHAQGETHEERIHENWTDSIRLATRNPPDLTIQILKGFLKDYEIPDSSQIDIKLSMINRYASLNRLDSALILAQITLESAENLKDITRICKANLANSWVNRSMNKSSLSLSHALQANSLALNLNDSSLLSATSNTLAGLYFDLEEDSLQIHYLEMAVAYGKSLGVHPARLNSVSNLVGILIEEMRFDEVKIYIPELTDLLEKLDPQNANPFNRTALISFTAYYYEIEDYQNAKKYNKLLLENASRYGAEEDISMATLFGIMIKLKKGQKLNLQDKYELLSIEEKVTHINDFIRQKGIMRNLILIWESEGDFKKSLYLQKLFFNMLDDNYRKDTKAKLLRFKEEFDAELKDNQIESLAYENQLKALEVEKEKSQRILFSIIAFVLLILLIVAFYLNNKLQKTKNQLQLSNQTKDKFFSIIAHDLRSPIIALQGVGSKMMEYIKNQNFEKTEQLAPNIDEALNRVNFLLDNLLNWAVVEQGNFVRKEVELKVQDMVDEVVKVSEIFAEGKGIKIKTEIDNFEFKADYNSIQLILRNLLSNAIKFSPKNSTVYIKAGLNPKPYFMIEDEGIGLSETQIQKINLGELFSDATEVKEKGFGIGLSLVQQFSKMNNAILKVESNTNKGSSFKLEFGI